MTRSFASLAAAAVLALGVAAPGFAQSRSQLIASAGLTTAEAGSLTLGQIAAAFANRGSSHADRQAVRIAPVQGSAGHAQLAASVGVGPDASLDAIAAAKYNRSASHADRQIVPGSVTRASRSPAVSGGWEQLIASAGLSPDEARGLTLGQIAAAKANQGVSHADRQAVAD